MINKKTVKIGKMIRKCTSKSRWAWFEAEVDGGKFKVRKEIGSVK
jgi:hypothetical protein